MRNENDLLIATQKLCDGLNAFRVEAVKRGIHTMEQHQFLQDFDSTPITFWVLPPSEGKDFFSPNEKFLQQFK